MFLELRFGTDNGGGVKGRRGVCGFKNFRLLEQVRRDSRGQSVRERAVSESSACTSAAFRCFEKKSDFPLVGSLSCLYYWEKPHQPARGGSATVRVLRCSWNRDPARITVAASRSDAESADSKNFRLLEQVRRNSSGQSIRERAVSESSASTSAAFRCFGKIRLSSRRLPFAPILPGKAASARAQRVRCAASACEVLRLKRPTAHAAVCRVRRSDTPPFPAAHAGDFKGRTG